MSFTCHAVLNCTLADCAQLADIYMHYLYTLIFISSPMASKPILVIALLPVIVLRAGYTLLRI